MENQFDKFINEKLKNLSVPVRDGVWDKLMNKQFDRFFGQSLKHHRADVPESVWDNIANNQLDQFFEDNLRNYIAPVPEAAWDNLADGQLDHFMGNALQNYEAPVPDGVWDKVADAQFDQFFGEKLADYVAPVPDNNWDKVAAAQFDQFFGKVFLNYTAPVPDRIWENIQPEEKEDRKIIYWFRVPAVAAILISLFVGGIFAAYVLVSLSEKKNKVPSNIEIQSSIKGKNRPNNSRISHDSIQQNEFENPGNDKIEKQNLENILESNPSLNSKEKELMVSKKTPSFLSEKQGKESVGNHPLINELNQLDKEHQTEGNSAILLNNRDNKNQKGNLSTILPIENLGTEKNVSEPNSLIEKKSTRLINGSNSKQKPIFNAEMKDQSGSTNNSNIEPNANSTMLLVNGQANEINNQNNYDYIPPYVSKYQPSLAVIASPEIMNSWKQGFSEKELKNIKHASSFKSNVICPTNRSNRNTDWFLEAYTSPDIAFKSVSNVSASQQYLNKKDSSEQMQLSYTAGFRLVKPITEDFVIKTGLQYSQINQKYAYRTENEIKTTTVVTVRTIIRAPGDTIVVADTSVLQTIGYKNNTVKNRFRSFDIPVLLGYQFGQGDLTFGINAGVIFNVSSWYEGVRLDSSLSVVPLNKNNNPIYKSSLGLGLYAGFSINKQINDDLHIFFEPYFRYNLSNMTTAQSTYNQKFSVGGLSIGLRYNLNRN